jgi:hypothetical protein
MKIYSSIAIVVAVLFATPASAQIGATEKAAILSAMNAARTAIAASPSEPALTWDDCLAKFAQAWADYLGKNNKFDHRNTSGDPANYTITNTCFPMQNLGENIYGYSKPDDGTQGAAAVASWVGEGANYTYASALTAVTAYNTAFAAAVAAYQASDGATWNPPTAPSSNVGCAATAVCGHYTQVIWAATTKVGCGVASGMNWATIIVCNFNPGGNVAGQLPYTVSAPASAASAALADPPAFSVYSAGPGSPLFMVNLTTNRVVTVIPDDGLPPDVVTPDGTTYLVDAAFNGFVFVLDAAGNLVTTIDVGGSPYGLTLGTDTSEVYVFNVDTVSVINTNTNKVVKTDSAPPNPFGGVTVSSGQLTEVK